MLRIVVALVLILFTSASALAGGHGAEVFKAQGCRACHQLAGQGGAIGPTLDGLGKRLDRKRLRQQIVAHETTRPAASMPTYGHLPPADLQALIDYLQGM